MKIRIVLFAIAICLLNTIAIGQKSGKFGIVAGANFANQHFEQNGDKKETNIKTGFHLGGNVHLPVVSKLFLELGVQYTTKGTKFAETEGGQSISLNYIEVPINLVLKPEIGSGHLLLGFGPYAALLLNGKVKKPNNEPIEVLVGRYMSFNQYPSTYVIREFDAGANLMFGFETASRLSIQLSADLGLRNLHPTVEQNIIPKTTSIRNTSFGVSLGYRFKPAAPHQWKSRKSR